MNKDFHNKQKDVTKLKLEIYNNYIETYLMKVLNKFPECFIWDFFCWPWYTEENEKWSPLILIDIIKKILNDKVLKTKKFKIHLFFNDEDPENIEKLKKNLIFKSDKVSIVYWKKNTIDLKSNILWLKEYKHMSKFLFLDPYWYIEKSTGFSKQDLEEIMKIKHTEILLFNPIQFAYRWFQASQKTNKKFVNIEKFNEDYWLNKKQEITDIYKFCKNMKAGLLSENIIKFVVPVLLEWKNKNSLFLLTNRIEWADLMINTIWRKTTGWWNKIVSDTTQLQLWNYNKDLQPDYFCGYLKDFKDKILKNIKEYGKLTNKDIIKLRCKFWIHYKIAEEILSSLIWKEIDINIDIKKTLYLHINHYNNEEKYILTLKI